jgi:hypothetical protein
MEASIKAMNKREHDLLVEKKDTLDKILEDIRTTNANKHVVTVIFDGARSYGNVLLNENTFEYDGQKKITEYDSVMVDQSHPKIFFKKEKGKWKYKGEVHVNECIARDISRKKHPQPSYTLQQIYGQSPMSLMPVAIPSLCTLTKFRDKLLALLDHGLIPEPEQRLCRGMVKCTMINHV